MSDRDGAARRTLAATCDKWWRLKHAARKHERRKPVHFLTTWELGLPPRQRRLFGQPDEPTLVKPDEHARLQGQKLS